MARVIKTMQLVEKYVNQNNNRYSLCVGNMEDIRNASNDLYDMINNSFKFGYIQGMKAAKAEQRKGGAVCG